MHPSCNPMHPSAHTELRGSTAAACHLVTTPDQVLILSYEAAQQHAALLNTAPPFALLVCDEVTKPGSLPRPPASPV